MKLPWVFKLRSWFRVKAACRQGFRTGMLGPNAGTHDMSAKPRKQEVHDWTDARELTL